MPFLPVIPKPWREALLKRPGRSGDSVLGASMCRSTVPWVSASGREMEALFRYVRRALALLRSLRELFQLAPTLETKRLRLRPLRSADLDDYAALYSDPEVLRYLSGAGGQPWDRERSWRHLSFLRGHWLMVGT